MKKGEGENEKGGRGNEVTESEEKGKGEIGWDSENEEGGDRMK